VLWFHGRDLAFTKTKQRDVKVTTRSLSWGAGPTCQNMDISLVGRLLDAIVEPEADSGSVPNDTPEAADPELAGGGWPREMFVEDTSSPPVHKLLDGLLCAICQQVVRSPVETECGHIFCESDAKKLPTHAPCPVCRRPAPLGFRRALVLEKMLLELAVRCPHPLAAPASAAATDSAAAAARCSWTGTLANYETKHRVDECVFRRVRCRRLCGSGGLSPHTLACHEAASCPRRLVTCPHCERDDIEARDLQAHQAGTCPGRPVPCPSPGCGQTVRASDLDAHVRDACDAATVPCKYAKIGCEAKLARRTAVAHQADTAAHLDLVADAVLRLALAAAAVPGATEAEAGGTQRTPAARGGVVARTARRAQTLAAGQMLRFDGASDRRLLAAGRWRITLVVTFGAGGDTSEAKNAGPSPRLVLVAQNADGTQREEFECYVEAVERRDSRGPVSRHRAFRLDEVIVDRKQPVRLGVRVPVGAATVTTCGARAGAPCAMLSASPGDSALFPGGSGSNSPSTPAPAQAGEATGKDKEEEDETSHRLDRLVVVLDEKTAREVLLPGPVRPLVFARPLDTLTLAECSALLPARLRRAVMVEHPPHDWTLAVVRPDRLGWLQMWDHVSSAAVRARLSDAMVEAGSALWMMRTGPAPLVEVVHYLEDTLPSDTAFGQPLIVGTPTVRDARRGGPRGPELASAEVAIRSGVRRQLQPFLVQGQGVPSDAESMYEIVVWLREDSVARRTLSTPHSLTQHLVATDAACRGLHIRRVLHPQAVLGLAWKPEAMRRFYGGPRTSSLAATSRLCATQFRD